MSAATATFSPAAAPVSLAPAPAPLPAAAPSFANSSAPALRLGSGEPMSASTRGRVESTIGADLSGVRVHRDSASASAADSLGARAFTLGPNIVLGSGQNQSNIGLMAHEATHVVQQRGAVGLQTYTTNSGNAFEREAQTNAARAESGETGSVQLRASPRVQFSLFDSITNVAGNVRERAVNFIRERARSIPGYDLLGFILSRDPITQQPVDRNAVNLLRALLGLVPGGQAMFENLQRAQVIQRAFEWVTTELTRLGLTWTNIRGAIERFLSSLGPSDILNLGGVFDRARAIFGPILRNIGTFALEAGQKVLEFIFEGALALAGSAGQRILGLFRRIGATFRLIVNDPVGFLRNLLAAVFGGFRQFGANILTHLRNAIFDWLFGALSDAGIRLPQRFDFRGILSIVLQILGLTYQRLRERLVRVVGEPAVRAIEQGFEFIRILVTQGIAAAWEKILEFATGLVDTVIEGIKSWVARTIIGQAVARIVTMFNPVGALINAIMTIYNTVMFVIERAQQIMAFVEAVTDSIANIATGNISAAVNYVERTLARILPLVISFLARLIGLGGISARIREIIQRIRAPIDRALDRIVTWVVERARNLLSRALGGDPNAPPAQRLERGLSEAVAAVNRLSGSHIGLVLINPVLAAVRARNRMQSLEAVQRNGRWAVSGRVNPADERMTQKLVDTGSGSGNFQTRITYHPADRRRGGVKMVANPLGPDHPQGSRPSDAGAPEIWTAVNQRRNLRRLYVLGHLLNHQLGGTGDDIRNLTPITFSANSTHHSRIEAEIKGLVNARPRSRARWVYYEVSVIYPGNRRSTADPVETAEGWLASRLEAKWRPLKIKQSDPTQLEPDGDLRTIEAVSNVPPYPQTAA